METFSGRFWEIPGSVLKLEVLKMFIDHKNTSVFFQAVSGMSSWSFSYRWTQYQCEKTTTKHQFIALLAREEKNKDVFFGYFFVWVPIFDPTLVQYFIQIPHIIFCCPLLAYDKWWFEQKKSPHFREKYLVLSYLKLSFRHSVERLRIFLSPHLKKKKNEHCNKGSATERAWTENPSLKNPESIHWAICDSTKAGGKKTLKYGRAHSASRAAVVWRWTWRSCSSLTVVYLLFSLKGRDVFTKFRAKLPAGRTDWRAFQLAFILYGGRRSRKFGGPLWKEKRAIMLCHRFWVFPGCSTKTDSCKFELVPARTACFWRSIYGLTLEARQACRGQSKQCRSVSFHHPPADASLQKQWLIAIPLTNTPHQVKGRLCPPRARRRGTSTGLSSNHRRRRSCQIPL